MSTAKSYPTADVVIALYGGEPVLQRWPGATEAQIRKLANDGRVSINGALYEVKSIQRSASYTSNFKDTIEFYVLPSSS